MSYHDLQEVILDSYEDHLLVVREAVNSVRTKEEALALLEYCNYLSVEQHKQLMERVHGKTKTE